MLRDATGGAVMAMIIYDHAVMAMIIHDHAVMIMPVM